MEKQEATKPTKPNTARANAEQRQYKTIMRAMSTDTGMAKFYHLTHHSPLKIRDSIPDLRSLPPIHIQTERENRYVLDGIKTDVYHNSPYHRPKRMSIIRPYNAVNDRHSAGYFRSPVVRAVMGRTFSAQETKRIQPEKKGLHRLSARRRSMRTPPLIDRQEKEKRFTLDNVKAERLRNKQNPICAEYNAMNDPHAQGYIRRSLVQKLLRKTVFEPQKLYPTITFYAPTKNDIVV